jgi:hypothetical protein
VGGFTEQAKVLEKKGLANNGGQVKFNITKEFEKDQ